uniref:Adenylate kinase 7 n=1 Tax=Pavo cristatus TaxID=9049 RepID=A0A8C9FF52_PAVCR
AKQLLVSHDKSVVAESMHSLTNKHLEEVNKQEQELLEAQSIPLRNYLMRHVMPTLMQGLNECCKIRPDDPVDFLAEYLFKNNPDVK